MSSFTYNRYSDFLKRKYNAKVYKLPINLPLSCPNRDGQIAVGGCTFCGDQGAGFETLSGSFSVSEQVEIHKKKMASLYKAEKFISYFQNFSNTYMPTDDFRKYMEAAASSDVVEISVATRPDCISDAYLQILKDISDKKDVNITIELGLQTSNYHTLKKINRGHGLAEFIDAVLRIKKFGFTVCAHVILNLPWDNIDDTIETSKLLSVLGVEYIKLHALYIIKNTELAKSYENNEIELICVEEYIERVIVFLEHLDPDAIIQRIIGRAPEESSVFANWGTSWWKIHDNILVKMENENRYQGKHFNYMNGKAVKRFTKS